MPEQLSDNSKLEIFRMANKCASMIMKGMSSAETQNHDLWESINNKFEEFNNNLCSSRPIFVIGSVKFDFISENCMPSFSPDESEEISISDVAKLISKARGRLLPGFVPYSSAISVISKIQKNWKDPSFECLNEIYNILFDFINNTIEKSFSRFPLLDGEMKQVNFLKY